MRDTTELGTRTVFTWQRHQARSMEEAITWPPNADALASLLIGSNAHFFRKDERLVWLSPEGELVLINAANARAILAQYVVTKRLANDGNGRWQAEYIPFAFEQGAEEPNAKTLIELLSKLLERAPRA